MKIYGDALIESRAHQSEECRVLACWLCSNLRSQIRQLDKAILETADRLGRRDVTAPLSSTCVDHFSRAGTSCTAMAYWLCSKLRCQIRQLASISSDNSKL